MFTRHDFIVILALCSFFTLGLSMTSSLGKNVKTNPNFCGVVGTQIVCNGNVLKVKGVNYYPKNHMWADMWNSWDWNEIQQEAKILPQLGINVARILVPYSLGGWNGPNVPQDHLDMLESLVNLFGQSGIFSLITLFDWETTFPANGTNLEQNHIQYIQAITTRLITNPFVLMYDVKNEPDHPNNINGNDNWNKDPADRDRIASWLARMINAIHYWDNGQHLVTIGMRWWENVETVIDLFEVVAFHSYWPNIDQEITDVQSYMPSWPRPIIVEEFGWPSAGRRTKDQKIEDDFSEQAQLNFYSKQLQGFAKHKISGGVAWMAFDAENYNNNDSFENFFGLWRYDYSMKPVASLYNQSIW